MRVPVNDGLQRPNGFRKIQPIMKNRIRRAFRFIVVACWMVSFADAQNGHPTPPPPRPGAKSVKCSGRVVPQLEDITSKTGIAFKHTSDPAKKYIVESMSGRVIFAGLRPRRLARYLFHECSDGRNSSERHEESRGSLSQQSRRHVYRRDREIRLNYFVLRHGGLSETITTTAGQTCI